MKISMGMVLGAGLVLAWALNREQTVQEETAAIIDSPVGQAAFENISGAFGTSYAENLFDAARTATTASDLAEFLVAPVNENLVLASDGGTYRRVSSPQTSAGWLAGYAALANPEEWQKRMVWAKANPTNNNHGEREYAQWLLQNDPELAVWRTTPMPMTGGGFYEVFL